MTHRLKSQLMSELISAVRANQGATDKMDEVAGRAMGVNRTDSRVMDVVQQRHRVPAGELARETALTTGAVTAVIDRMEKKGYLRRVTDPGDRRRVIVEMTELADERADHLYGPLADAALPMLDGFSSAELELITRFLRASTDIVEARAAAIRAELGGDA